MKHKIIWDEQELSCFRGTCPRCDAVHDAQVNFVRRTNGKGRPNRKHGIVIPPCITINCHCGGTRFKTRPLQEVNLFPL